MEVESLSVLSELGLKLVRSFLKYLDAFSGIPFGKYVVLGFGAFLIFIKKYIIPKRFWKRD